MHREGEAQTDIFYTHQHATAPHKTRFLTHAVFMSAAAAHDLPAE